MSDLDLDALVAVAQAATPGECACGCGGTPSKRARFLRGHNMRNEPQRRLQCAVRGPLDCWPWPGEPVDGYGRVEVDGVAYRAHRWAWEQLRGPIADSLVLDHLCRNRACVNPDHLEPVTHGENTARGIGISAVNKRKTHCKHGHEFTPENTIRRRDGRQCRACRDRRNRDAYVARKNGAAA